MSEIRANPSACDGCVSCVENCPVGVFVLREITEDERTSLSFPGKIKVKGDGEIFY